jgi:hypothetical protein
MRTEKSVTSITWIPSEAISGMPKMPFEMGITHYDEPPPDRVDDLEELRQRDAFREANVLRAWVEFEDGRPTAHGYSGDAYLGVTRLKIARRELAFPAVKYPLLQAEPEVRDDSVRFVQSAGGHMGLPAPRRVSGKPFFKIRSASAWTTLALTIHADGSHEHELVGASPFPRHWVYDDGGQLVEKSGTIDFDQWYRKSHGPRTPWGEEDSPAITTAVESELERELSASLMQNGKQLQRRTIEQGQALVEQGAEGDELYLLLDGVVDVEVDGDVVAEIGPGALLGERALLEGGKRTATVWATTPVRVVVVPRDAIDESALPELAASHRREEG